MAKKKSRKRGPKRKRRNRGSKGSSFERLLCNEFSEWWSRGRRTDIFWRTSISGGRARTRALKGKQTHAQHGDMAATSPSGQPLIDAVTIEFKRGYNQNTLQDLLDRSNTAALQQYEKWIVKAIKDHKAAGSFSWMLITKRDKREPIVIIPHDLFYALYSSVGPHTICVRASIRNKAKSVRDLTVYAMLLNDFFEGTQPLAFKHIARDHKKSKRKRNETRAKRKAQKRNQSK